MIADGPEQEAPFELQYGRDVWCQNLGPVAKVAEVMSQWLGSIDYDGTETAR